jgi:hypothetical protein
MTETEWDSCRDPRLLVQILVRASRQKELHLFGCACCRRVWPLLSDERLRRGVEVRERYERELATEEELKEAMRDARIARMDVRWPLILSGIRDDHAREAGPAWAAGSAANATYGNCHGASDLAALAKACADVGDWQRSYDAERAAQCDFLRSIVANPLGLA